MVRQPPSFTLFPYTTLFRSAFHHIQVELLFGGFLVRVADREIAAAGEIGRPVGPGVTLEKLDIDLQQELRDIHRVAEVAQCAEDRKSTRLNSSHPSISYAVF